MSIFGVCGFGSAYYIPGTGDANTQFAASVTKLGDVDGDGTVRGH